MKCLRLTGRGMTAASRACLAERMISDGRLWMAMSEVPGAIETAPAQGDVV